MIEAVVFAALFLVAWLMNRSKTYIVLLVAALANIMIYPYTTEGSIFLEATLTIFTLSALIAFADKHGMYQIGVLFIALICHIKAEYMMVNNTDPTGFGFAITSITILQLLGACHGLFTRISERLRAIDSHWVRSGDEYYPFGNKACQKEQQGH